MANFQAFLDEIKQLSPEEQFARRSEFFEKHVIPDPDYLIEFPTPEARAAFRAEVTGPAPPPSGGVGRAVGADIRAFLEQGGLRGPGPIESLGELVKYYGKVDQPLFKQFPAVDKALQVLGIPGRAVSRTYEKGESLLTGRPPAQSGMSEGLGTITDVLLGGTVMLRGAARGAPPDRQRCRGEPDR